MLYMINMYKSVVLVFILQTFFYYAKGDSKLLSQGIEHLMECMSQAAEGFSIDTCQEMLQDGNDNSLAKYESCKCLGACVSKKLGIMDENGNGIKGKFEEYINELESDTWKQEAKNVYEKCKDVPGKNCELSYNFMACGMKNSPMARDIIKTMAGGGVSK